MIRSVILAHNGTPVMDKRKARLIAILTFVILLVSCLPLPAPTTISPTNSPEAIYSVSPTKQVVTLEPTLPPIQTSTPTLAPSLIPTSAASGKVVVWAPLRIKDLLDRPRILDGFKQHYPGIDLKWVVKDAPQIENDLLHAGKKPREVNVVFLEGEQASEAAISGALSEISSPTSGKDKSNNPISSIDISFENRVYALTLFQEPIVVYYRRDIFGKAGLAATPSEVAKLIPTWQSLLSTCQIILSKTKYPCFDLNRADNSGELFEYMQQTQGLSYFDETWKLNFSSEDLISSLSDLSGFWKSGVVGDELAWTPGWLDHLASLENPVALVFGTPALGKALETWIAPELGGKWGIVPLPSYGHDPSFSARGPGGYLAVTSGSENQVASLEVIRFFTRDPSVQDALFDEKEYFPAFVNSSDISKLEQPDPFFADQIPADVFCVSSNFSERSLFGPGYHEIHNLIEEAVRQVATGRMQSDTAIRQLIEKQLRSTPQP